MTTRSSRATPCSARSLEKPNKQMRKQRARAPLYLNGAGHAWRWNCQSPSCNERQLLAQQFWPVIHNNNALSDVGNFLYLQSALTEKAALAVATLQQTRVNYNTAIERLKERFGHTNAQLVEHLTQLLDLPNVQGGNEVSGIRHLYGHLQYNMSALTALDVKTTSFRAALSSTVLRMLPSELVLDNYRRCSADKEDNGLRTESLLDFLETEVESRMQPIQVGWRDLEKQKYTSSKVSVASLFSEVVIHEHSALRRITQQRSVKHHYLSKKKSNEHFVRRVDVSIALWKATLQNNDTRKVSNARILVEGTWPKCMTQDGSKVTIQQYSCSWQQPKEMCFSKQSKSRGRGISKEIWPGALYKHANFHHHCHLIFHYQHFSF